MKIASYKNSGTVSYGVVKGNEIVTVSVEFALRYPTLRQVLEGDALQALADDTDNRPTEQSIVDIQLVPPVYNSQRIICVGINYAKRSPLDNPLPPPKHIILFAKLDGTLVGHGEALEIPSGVAANTFDYEGEIALVIGKPGRHILPEQAFDHVAGYTIVNDGSVREWQNHSVHTGKNFANSGACGPWMATADEIEDPFAITLKTRLNGEEVQNTSAAEMIFSIPELIAYISHTIDLRAGDIISTGSPEGSGGSRQPPRFLRAGDTLDIEVSGVGVLQNRVG